MFPKISDGDTKTDIIIYELEDGKLQLMRRPMPDISVFMTRDGIKGHKTQDGDSEFGVLEKCVRPGYYDNSHIGPNGMPTLAKIGEKSVYIDVTHGVYNEVLAQDGDMA